MVYYPMNACFSFTNGKAAGAWNIRIVLGAIQPTCIPSYMFLAWCFVQGHFYKHVYLLTSPVGPDLIRQDASNSNYRHTSKGQIFQQGSRTSFINRRHSRTCHKHSRIFPHFLLELSNFEQRIWIQIYEANIIKKNVGKEFQNSKTIHKN
jgi:hypothetical protein